MFTSETESISDMDSLRSVLYMMPVFFAVLLFHIIYAKSSDKISLNQSIDRGLEEKKNKGMWNALIFTSSFYI